jgi:membrane associated rhomboid family serine protease
VPGVADGSSWELLTSMFLHIEPWHIGANMLSLYLFGPQVERVLGRVRFLVVYLVSGLTGSAVVFWLADPSGLTLGASGAIFGLLGAFLVLAHKTGGDVRGVLTLLVLNGVLTFVIPNISWQGHLGGFLGGLAVTGALVYAPRERRTLVQSLAVGGLLGLVALAVVLRAVALS